MLKHLLALGLERKSKHMSNSTSFIYALIDPFTNKVRYIGKSTNPQKRFNTHLNTNDGTHCHNWINGLLNADAQPILEVIEEAENSIINELEQFWIAEYKRLGAKLTNLTPGGDGYPVGWKMSETAKQNLSHAKQGVPFSSKHRNNMSGENHRSFKHPENTPSGDKSGRRLHPENYPKGEDSYFGTHPFKGENNGRAKLTEAQVIQARQWMSDGMSAYQVSKILGIAYGTAKRIKSRKLWKHI